jgi:hypothetical protein
MTNYKSLNYIIPPRNQGQIVEVSYAITPDEVVRRTTDRSDGSVMFETADICDLLGEFEPQNREPSVPSDAWTTVDGDEATP